MDNQLDKIRQLETELQLLKEKLKISQSLVKIGFWELNRESRELFLSEESLQILKMPAECQRISLNEILKFILKFDQVPFATEMNLLISGEEHIDFEFSIQNPENQEIHTIKAIANAMVKNKFNPDNFIGIFQDITEQKKTELYLKNAKNKAEEADILKSAFLANMSHEIRTPLNAILGFSQLLTNPEIPNRQRQEYSEYITSSANNLLNLIRDIVDVSKIEAGKMNIEKGNCQVNKILNEIKITFEKEKQRQSKNQIQLILNTDIADEEFTIYTDPFRFHQILINLIGNALKFTDTGSIEFGYLMKDEKHLLFYVQDTGIGIPEDKLDLIFSRFGQIIDNKIKNPGGTGLGLSITKHLVGRLGGKIWVESKIDVGTRFSFTLPLVKLKNKKIYPVDFKTEFKVIDIKQIKILAVEDDNINMILLEDTLKMYIKNIQIEKAYNGIEALKKLEIEDFDLIIMDIRMPLLDGYAATKYIREEFPAPKNNIPILGLSAHALKNEIEEGKKLGMNEFLSKPIQPEELLLKIKRLVNIQHTEIIEPEVQKKQSTEYHINNEIVDLQFFNKLYKNNTEKINKIISTYLAQVPDQIIQLEEALTNEKNEVLKNLSHSLKSIFKYLGRYDISELAREIEYYSFEENKENYILERLEKIKLYWLEIEKTLKDKLIKSQV